MERLDKFLCDKGLGTRSEVKTYIKKGWVTIEGQMIKQPDYKFDENNTTVYFQDKPYTYAKY